MDLPEVLRELYRVTAPGAKIRLSGAELPFTLSEFRDVRNLRALVYRAYVVLNGICFHITGRVFRYPLKPRHIEYFCTRKSLLRAAKRAGFADARIVPRKPITIEARKPITTVIDQRPRSWRSA